MPARSRGRRTTRSSSSSNKLRNYIIGGLIAVAVIGLGVLIYLSTRPPAPLEGLVQHPRPSRGHDNTLDIPFGELPPVGGTHHDRWQNCGVYTEPVEAENAVHSLEHGAVWITYQPNLAAEQVAMLEEQARGEPFVLLSPYPQQRSPIVLTAWGLQLELDDASDGRIAQFIDRYQQGPQTPERGAACTGGVGDPVS